MQPFHPEWASFSSSWMKVASLSSMSVTLVPRLHPAQQCGDIDMQGAVLRCCCLLRRQALPCGRRRVRGKVQLGLQGPQLAQEGAWRGAIGERLVLVQELGPVRGESGIEFGPERLGALHQRPASERRLHPLPV